MRSAIALALVVNSLVVTAHLLAQAPASKPNLVFVLADQLRYQSCGFAGDSKARTPNLDAFARQGVVFRNAVSGHPVCAAYRASLFTGKYTTSTGMVINELRMNPNHECLAQVLTRHGYDTGYIGKWHLWANELGNHYDPKNSFTPPGPYRFGFDGFWAAYNFHHEYFNGYYHTDSPEKIPVKGYEPDVQTDLAIARIKHAAIAGKPFALFLSVGTPHDPWNTNNVPAKFLNMFADEAGKSRFTLPPNYKPDNDPYSDAWGRFKGPRERQSIPEWLRVYYAMTANLDWNIGRLLKAIDEAGLHGNTIVVFTSDHGEMMGAQGRRAKNIFYEEAVRVPFLMRWPATIPAGSTSDACLNTPDIMPTLLGLAGLAHPVQGRGHRPQPLRARQARAGARSGVYAEHRRLRHLGRRLRMARAARQAIHLCDLSEGPEGTAVRQPQGPLSAPEPGGEPRAGADAEPLPRPAEDAHEGAGRHLRGQHLVSRPLGQRPHHYPRAVTARIAPSSRDQGPWASL